ncbi:hypothetical protein H5410_047480 [Solanum commersonii]|uniref:Uncharacterized protein n=1 Tax=Solanum commersonii TaxID=4109 RepID=A0A9J5XIS9_SOLCO|nr:hypothetical protein H5410_047480 [Solanum commersonii]
MRSLSSSPTRECTEKSRSVNSSLQTSTIAVLTKLFQQLPHPFFATAAHPACSPDFVGFELISCTNEGLEAGDTRKELIYMPIYTDIHQL